MLSNTTSAAAAFVEQAQHIAELGSRMICGIAGCVYIPTASVTYDDYGRKVYNYTCERCSAPKAVPSYKHQKFLRSPACNWRNYRDRS